LSSDNLANDRLLDQLAFFHAPFLAIGHVRKEGSGFEFAPTPWSPVL
jgi:hypothetical protein